MSDDGKSGRALIAGSIGIIVTMLFHPTGHELFEAGEGVSGAHAAVATHVLALACAPLLFLGACGLTRRANGADRLAFGALVLFGFGLLAVVIAATASGLVAPGLVREILAAAADSAQVWRAVLDYNGRLNQAFAALYVVASSAAIVLWSAAILRSGALARALGLYGCILGPLVVLAFVSGHVHLDVHGFGLIVFGQAAWFSSAGVLLCRAKGA